MSEDFIPTLLNVRSVADTRERSRVTEAHETAREKIFNLNKATGDILDHWNAGEITKIPAIVKKMQHDYGVTMDPGNIIYSAQIAAKIERETRDMLNSPTTFPVQRRHKPGERKP